VIASQVDGVGTSGIWPAAKIYSNRVFAGAGTTSVADYMRAMNWCRQQPGVKVINVSLSGIAGATTTERRFLSDKIAEVRSNPYFINVVAAAGNNGSALTVGYPAVADGVFSVGASDATGALASFSNRGLGLDIATSGTDSCVTTSRGSRLASGSGTSFAAPVVSAVLAALRSYDTSLTPDQAEALLLDSADNVNGVKVLNAARAFRADPTVDTLASGSPITGVGQTAEIPCATAVPSPAGVATGDGQPTKAKSPEAAPSAPAMTVASSPLPAPIIDVPLPAATRPTARKLRAPTLRSVRYREGLLEIHIGGYERGDRSLCRVTYRTKHGLKSRTVVRARSMLRIRVPNWTSVRVRLRRAGAETSSAAVARAGREF
jgi:subtilisin family serine protease